MTRKRLIRTAKMDYSLMCTHCYELIPITVSDIGIDITGSFSNNLQFTFDDRFDTSATLYNMFLEGLSIQHNCTNDSTIDAHMVPIDRNIAKVVSGFNKLGYPTLYSCEGHVYSCNAFSIPYVAFDINPDTMDNQNYLSNLQLAITTGTLQLAITTGTSVPDIQKNVICEFNENMINNNLMISLDLTCNHEDVEFIREKITLFCRLLENVVLVLEPMDKKEGV